MVPVPVAVVMLAPAEGFDNVTVNVLSEAATPPLIVTGMVLT